jgi:hypothetical protein
VRNGTILTETTTAFGVFAAHKVTCARLVVAELTGAGLFQTLCGTFSGFEFRHCLHPLYLMFTTGRVNALPFSGAAILRPPYSILHFAGYFH